MKYKSLIIMAMMSFNVLAVEVVDESDYKSEFDIEACVACQDDFSSHVPMKNPSEEFRSLVVRCDDGRISGERIIEFYFKGLSRVYKAATDIYTYDDIEKPAKKVCGEMFKRYSPPPPPTDAPWG